MRRKDYPKNSTASAAKRSIAFSCTNLLIQLTYVEFRNTLQGDSDPKPWRPQSRWDWLEFRQHIKCLSQVARFRTLWPANQCREDSKASATQTGPPANFQETTL